MKKRFLDWDLGIIYAFLIIRLIINMEMKALSLAFVISYAILIFLLKNNIQFFSTTLILFLTIDNMLATYFATKIGELSLIFYGTIAINIIIMFLVLQNTHNHFKK